MDQRERELAIRPDASFLVQAPAGSGKTSLLTQRFLRLLALVEEPEEIAAITFTRKAAAEMRARILGELREASTGHAPANAYQQQTRALALAALDRDRKRNWQVLASPRRLRIQTIDSFQASIVIRLPLLSQLGSVSATTEHAAPLHNAAVREALRVMAGAENRSSLVELLGLLDNNLEALASSLANLLAKRDQWLPLIGARPLGPGPEGAEAALELRAQLEANIRLLLEPDVAQLRALAPASLGPEIASLARFAADNMAGQGSSIEALCGLRDWPLGKVDDLPAWRAMGGLLLTGSNSLRKAVDKRVGFPADRKNEKERMLTVLNVLREDPDFCEALHRVVALPDPHYTDGQWRVLEALFRFLGDAIRQLYLQFAERRETDFSEVALRATAALEASPGVPTLLAERLDAQLRHILVDEFQDTSVLQMVLLRRLTENWTPGDGRTLFLVGDPMQSIYGFRNARVDLFLRAWEGLLPGLPPLETLQLKRNFRSRRTLIDSFNECFQPHFPNMNDAASGAVSYADAAADPEEADTETDRIQYHAFLDATPASEADWIAEEIERIRIEDVKGGDTRSIGVLFRKAANAAIVGEALTRRGIRFQAIDVEALHGLPVIQDLQTIWDALLSPQDRLSWLSLLRAPWNALTLKELERLSTLAGESSLWDALREQAASNPLSFDDEHQLRVKRSVALFEEAYQWRGRLPLVDVLRNVWERSGAQRYHSDARAQVAASQFFRLLSELDEADLLRSSQALEEALAQLHAPPDPEAPDTLQLLTIHKAKGLEFDVVFIPYLNAGRANNDLPALRWEEIPLPDGSETDVDAALVIAPRYAVGESRSAINKYLSDRQRCRENYESVRVLYVAFTRAKERLHLLASIDPAKAASADELCPIRDSYVELLWPQFEAEFRNAWAAMTPPDPLAVEADIEPAYPLLRRLSAEELPQWTQPAWTLNAMEAEQEPQFFKPHGPFETLDTAAGTLFHRLMERIGFGAVLARASESADRLLPVILDEMRALLPGELHLEGASQRVVDAIRQTGRSAFGRWVFQDDHCEVRSEQAVGYLDGSQWRTVRIDRMFRDTMGAMHIVDFKLVDASPADAAEFLRMQRRAYASQLEIYARLLQLQKAEDVTVTLYFPLQDLREQWVVTPRVQQA